MSSCCQRQQQANFDMQVINFLILFVGLANAIIEFIDPACGPGNIAFITAAFADAITVATDAQIQLLSFDPLAKSLTDPRMGIYTPLFNPGDLQTIINYLDSITSVLSTGYKLRIYCEGTNLNRFVSLPDPNTGVPGWFDKDFYHNARPDQSIPIWVKMGARPTGSWTKHGWTIDQNADCSNQAHIQLSQDMLAATRVSTDNRFFTSIRSFGLGTGKNFNHLDYIRPLSRTILHELFHAVAGLNTASMPPVPIVLDVPKPGTTSRAYGTFNECMSQKSAPIPTVRQAECLTMLAVGLYLDQIQGKPAFWSVGVVDRTTLKPANLPGTSSSGSRLRHRALRDIGDNTV